MQNNSSPKPAVVYIRFSDEKQSKGDSVNRQNRSFAAFCKANGYTVVQTIQDEGESAFTGMHLSNGNLGRFLREADKGSFQGHVFLFEELTRLSRQGVLAVFTLVTRLLNAGLTVRDITTGVEIATLADLNKPLVALVMSVNAVVGAMHSGELSRKLLAVRQSERDRAAALGIASTPVCPAWCSAKPGEKPQAVPARASTVSLIFDLAASGLGAKSIVRQLIAKHRDPFNRTVRWTPEYVTTILANRSVLGYFQPHRLTVESRPDGKQVKVRVPVGEEIALYPAVVTVSQWNEARAAVEARNRLKGRAVGTRRADGNVNNVLSPLVFDGTRHRIMNFYQKAGDHPYFVTKWAAKSKSNYLRYDVLEGAFLKFLEATDWKEIAGHGQSEEEKAAQNDLEALLVDIEKSRRAVAGIEKAIEEAEAEGKFEGLRALAARVEGHQSRLATLADKQNALRGILEAAQAKCEALHSPEELLAKIAAQDVKTRLALKAQIARRVARIEVHFNSLSSQVARVTFSNGCVKWVLISASGRGRKRSVGGWTWDPAKIRANIPNLFTKP
jgi:DNA invertase Pin-like site-specific DNA recombinase